MSTSDVYRKSDAISIARSGKHALWQTQRTMRSGYAVVNVYRTLKGLYLNGDYTSADDT